MAFGSKVHYMSGLKIGKDPVHGSSVADILLLEAESGRIHRRAEGLEISGVSQLIDHAHFVPGLLHEPTDKCGADKPASTGNDHSVCHTPQHLFCKILFLYHTPDLRKSKRVCRELWEKKHGSGAVDRDVCQRFQKIFDLRKSFAFIRLCRKNRLFAQTDVLGFPQ